MASREHVISRIHEQPVSDGCGWPEMTRMKIPQNYMSISIPLQITT